MTRADSEADTPRARSRMLWWSAIACGLASCVSQAPLPKRAALESSAGETAPTDFAAMVASADVIYFPAERAASAGRGEPAALMLEAFENSGAPFAIAWDLIDATQQALLDQISATPARGKGGLVERLDLAGNGRAREHCRAVLLRESGATNVRHLALRLPEPILGKLRTGGVLSGEEQEQMGMRFNPPAAGLERFATRMTAAESLSGRDVAAAYRAELAAQEFGASQIVRYFQTGGGGKLLVFLRSSDLESGEGVPFFVAQKLALRQLILGPNASRNDAARLLTGARRDGGRGIEIVDGAPAASGH